MSRSLTVWWEGRVVGTLGLDSHGDMNFYYAPEWLADPSRPALSVSLPKHAESFKRRECRPFFAGLLPEEAQREAVARALGLSAGNDFRLLEALGGDVAGALTLWPEGETPPDGGEGHKAVPLGENALVDFLDTLPRRPFLAGAEGLRLSLAGAQSKIPVVLVNGQVALPVPGQPTTHILKPPLPRFAGTTENEAFAMRLAAAIGLSVAPVEPRKVAGRPYLLVSRYDRWIDEAGRARRLHQEDFCQALGIPPEHKYAAEGGPTFKMGFDLIRRACTRPAIALLKLLDAAILNLVIGNADAHGKNFSLLYRSGDFGLAPLYDLMCTVAYPEVSPKLAMRFAKRATLEEMDARTWADFAKDIGMSAPFVRRRVKMLAQLAGAEARRVAGSIIDLGFDKPALTDYARLVEGRAEILVGNT